MEGGLINCGTEIIACSTAILALLDAIAQGATGVDDLSETVAFTQAGWVELLSRLMGSDRSVLYLLNNTPVKERQ